MIIHRPPTTNTRALAADGARCRGWRSCRVPLYALMSEQGGPGYVTMENMCSREFPFSPRSATKLEVGDVLALPCEDGTWAVLQVSALRRTGPGARTTFGVGVLLWRGHERPTAADVAGLEFVAHGLTRIEIFSAGGAEVVTNTTLASGVQPNTYYGARSSVVRSLRRPHGRARPGRQRARSMTPESRRLTQAACGLAPGTSAPLTGGRSAASSRL
jgi:hypothetical protein